MRNLKKRSQKELQHYSKQHLLMAKYYANQLALKRSGSEIERIGTTLYSSKIELTPHQIQAALFAFKSPLDKGVILADEVGLGKTIEAGIVIAQIKYEHDAKVLIVAPASLMKQWESELEDKFGLSSIIMDRKQYNCLKQKGLVNPFDIKKDVIICSYQMCSSLNEDILSSDIELAVVDEAHKLRNVYNKKNVIANNIKKGLANKKKILLTATPIQNNLMDLYGLVSIIDENIFGDKIAFKYNYIKNFQEYEKDLNDRLKEVLHRTLRKQVSYYINFTNRLPRTYTFEQNKEEKEVYNLVRQLILNSDQETYLIPPQQRHLVLLVLCKLMGSSTTAIISTLSNMRERLISMQKKGKFIPIKDDILNEAQTLGNIEEIEYGLEKKINQKELQREISQIDMIIAKANLIPLDSKYKVLLQALSYSFEHLKEIGALEKVIIFTESKKTQMYLLDRLKHDGYTDVITYNGNNSDEISQTIYKDWAKCHAEEIKHNNKTVNMKAAILDYFRKNARILIATEAGAEGLNLQFCSLVINYDLPWNPQRVEQRIGRCHRLGQKFDVVVINFITANNLVEQRIYELLNKKFRVFNEILGSSDSIIGKLEDGKDIERSILNIYKTCRTVQEIEKAFDELQSEYKQEIEESMNKTRKDVLDNFEEDLQELFENLMGTAEKTVNKIEQFLWRLTQCLLEDAKFDDRNKIFYTPDHKVHYLLKNDETQGVWHNLNSGLGKKIVNYALNIPETRGHLVFDITNYKYNIGKIQELKGHKGVIIFTKLVIEAIETEEYLIFNGVLDDGTKISQDVCNKLFRLAASEDYSKKPDNKILFELQKDKQSSVQAVVNKSKEINNELISKKINQINAWADDKIESTQLEVEKMRLQRKELQKLSDLAVDVSEKEHYELEIMDISKKIRSKWIQLADNEEKIENIRRKMVEDIQRNAMKQTRVYPIFEISFEVK